MKKRRRVLALFISIFSKNRSFSDARWFYGKKLKIGMGSLYLTENRLSWNEMYCASDDHNYTACVNKSASLKEHFFLGKLYVSFEKVYNNMIGNIISFYRIFVLWNLDVWFRNYGKSCEVPPNLFGLIH